MRVGSRKHFDLLFESLTKGDGHANQQSNKREGRGTGTVPHTTGDVRMGSKKESAALRECRGRGCDNRATSYGVPGSEESGEVECLAGNREGSGAMPRKDPDAVPQDQSEQVRVVTDHTAGRSADGSGDGGVRIYSSGAARSHITERYDLLPTAGVRRAAEAMGHGAERFGEHNWMKGMPIGHVLNHALAHIFNHLQGDRTDDHLGHAVANLMMACHFDEVNDE